MIITSFDPIFSIVIGLPGLCAGLFLLYVVWRRQRAQQALLTTGIRTTATITSTKVALSMSGVSMYEVAYEYDAPDAQGKIIKMQAPEPLMVDASALRKLQASGPMAVIYDPNQPGHVVPIDLQGGGLNKILIFLSGILLVAGALGLLYGLSHL